MYRVTSLAEDTNIPMNSYSIVFSVTFWYWYTHMSFTNHLCWHANYVGNIYKWCEDKLKRGRINDLKKSINKTISEW